MDTWGELGKRLGNRDWSDLKPVVATQAPTASGVGHIADLQGRAITLAHLAVHGEMEQRGTPIYSAICSLTRITQIVLSVPGSTRNVPRFHSTPEPLEFLSVYGRS